mgnify:CR=1 FL=1
MGVEYYHADQVLTSSPDVADHPLPAHERDSYLKRCSRTAAGTRTGARTEVTRGLHTGHKQALTSAAAKRAHPLLRGSRAGLIPEASIIDCNVPLGSDIAGALAACTRGAMDTPLPMMGEVPPCGAATVIAGGRAVTTAPGRARTPATTGDWAAAGT